MFLFGFWIQELQNCHSQFHSNIIKYLQEKINKNKKIKIFVSQVKSFIIKTWFNAFFNTSDGFLNIFQENVGAFYRNCLITTKLFLSTKSTFEILPLGNIWRSFLARWNFWKTMGGSLEILILIKKKCFFLQRQVLLEIINYLHDLRLRYKLKVKTLRNFPIKSVS